MMPSDYTVMMQCLVAGSAERHWSLAYADVDHQYAFICPSTAQVVQILC